MAKPKVGGSAGQGKYPEGDQHLSESENEVMDVIWSSPEPLTTNDIHGEISMNRRAANREIASFTTIDSIVRRLIGRGVIITEKKPARVVVNSPRLSRPQYAAYAMNYITKSVLKRSLASVLSELGRTNGSGSADHSANQEVQQLRETIADLAKD